MFYNEPIWKCSGTRMFSDVFRCLFDHQNLLPIGNSHIVLEIHICKCEKYGTRFLSRANDGFIRGEYHWCDFS